MQESVQEAAPKIVLNKEQAHIVHNFFQRYGSKEVWKVDTFLLNMINDVLAAHNPPRLPSEIIPDGD